MKKLGISTLVLMLCLVVSIVSADGADKDFAVGVSYSDMNDFDTDWGVRLQWWLEDNWLLAGGWNNVDTTVNSAGGPMRVDGQLWQLDLSYIIDSGQWYYGIGGGVRNIDADWTLATITNDAKEIEPQGHVVVGLRMGAAFVDVRYEVGADMFDYSADGVQGTLGVNFDLPSVSFGKGKAAPAPAPTQTRSMYWEPTDVQDSFRKSAVESAAVSCGGMTAPQAKWDRFYFPKQFP